MDVKASMKLVKLTFVFLLLCSDIDSLSSVNGEDVILCKDKEREALLNLKQGLKNMSSYSGDYFSSWGTAKGEMECCNWDGVGCSRTTGHVTSLQLTYLRGKIRPALLQLSQLESLDMSFNDFQGNKIPEFIGSLAKLQHLDLSFSNFSGDVPYQLGNLTNLRELDLSHNNLTSKDLTWLSNLSFLSKLYMSSNVLEGPLSWLSSLSMLTNLELSDNRFKGHLPWLSNLSSLSTLYLSNNRFEGPFSNLFLQHNKLTKLPRNLEVLDVSYNSLTGTISEVHLSHLHKLLSLDLSFSSLALNFSPNWTPPFQLYRIALAGCQMGHRFPSWIRTQRYFIYFDLSSVNISGKIPDWFWNSSHQLIYFNISYNQISGSVPDLSPNFDPTISSTIDMSFNNFSGPLPSFHPNSQIVILSHNVFRGSIESLCRVTYPFLLLLDLSNNQLSGKLPNCWENMTSLEVLNIDDNKFSGHLPHSLGYLTQLQLLFFGHNNFTGELPSALSNCSWIQFLDGGGNELTGSIPAWMGTLTELSILCLSNNRLSGKLPNCWENMTSLVILNINDNKFSGHLPHSLGYLTQLVLLRFRNNNLTGELPSRLSNCSRLELIDGGGNELTGSIPAWMGTLMKLSTLTLRKNNFSRSIPPEICHLTSIQVLDLSENQFSGRIPRCFNNFSSIMLSKRSTESPYDFSFLNGYNDILVVQWKRKESQFKNNRGLLKLIDLSSNELWGDIPQEVFDLHGLVSLNLSHNILTGSINPNIGEMKRLESLDLSRNKLSGEIPIGLAKLDGLAVLDLSRNDLSGEIPKGTQLQSFEPSSYATNLALCGHPLPNCAWNSPSSADNQGNEDDIGDESEYVISAVMGYVVGVWIVIGPLLYQRSWRDAYFGYLSDIGDWLYETAITCCRRLMRYFKNGKH